MAAEQGKPADWQDAAWWRACLLGGAIGDALGAPIEFDDWPAIRSRFGRCGLTELVPHDGRLGAITDDTQLTLFTAEAVLGYLRRGSSYGVASLDYALAYSYQRWLATQGEQPVSPSARSVELRGMLWECSELHRRRGPGATCLAALRSGQVGTLENPINASKGCGGVMRAAPGVALRGGSMLHGKVIAAVTHGHPTGQLAAGALVVLLRQIALGATLEEALDVALDELAAEPDAAETSSALRQARALARSSVPAGPDAVERLGAGWVAEEALAIAVYAALRSGGNLRRGVLLAVNHSGDSDSTGSIAGNLLGALHGEAALPPDWVEALEVADVIDTVSADLARSGSDLREDSDRAYFIEHSRRYPYQ